MRLSQSFWQTFKEVPSDAEVPSHQLMIRAGLIHKSGAGLYSYLHFSLRAIQNVENIIREELDRVGCQEILMPMVTSGDLWKESGRWDAMGGQMAKFKDKAGRDLCLSPTNEESITDIFRKFIRSYKSLPLTFYQINTKFRDEIRPRFGLLRGREFTMKDAYSFHMNKECLNKVYDNLHKAYSSIFKRLGLNFMAVEADAGAMASSDQKTHEFQVLADTGEDDIIYSKNYAANIEKAKTLRSHTQFNLSSLEKYDIETVDLHTISDVCTSLDLPEHHALKTLVFMYAKSGEIKPLLAILLGDDELNEIKLLAHLSADELYPASPEDLEKWGFIKGFIGPEGFESKMKIIFDSEIKKEAFYLVGANKKNYHTQGYSPEKEIKDYFCADLRLAKSGDLTMAGEVVGLKRGIEVGHIFQLGHKYTKALNASVLDKNGKTSHPLMGCYGIGVTRIIAAAIEQSHDEKGIIWPKNMAPYQLHFISLAKSDEVKNLVETIYKELLDAGIKVVLDDRKASPGFKFKDADLLGLPLQLVLGERDYKETEKLGLIDRKTGTKILISKAEVIASITEAWGKL